MDNADRAQIEIEREMERLMRRPVPPSPEPTGECLWCGEPLTAGRRWCDAGCRDDWERDYASA